MGRPIAVILGVSGQDGSYLSEFLLKKDYKVIGVRRRSSAGSLWRLENCLGNERFELIEGDITDYSSILNILSYYKPNEIYNLSAQSNVGTSFKQPINTWRICAEGVINLLEAIKFLNLPAKLYQASSSEMFGTSFNMFFPSEDISQIIEENLEPYKAQNENTRFNPQSPYAIAKLAAHNSIKLYREAYGLWCVGGILFNHESPRRGVNFVTRKITNHFFHYPNIKVQLGNIDSFRDWGYAPEYIEAMWLMLQQPSPKDYVIGIGETHSIRDFLEEFIQIRFNGNEYYKGCIDIKEEYKRPAEVPYLCANATLAQKELGWKPKTKFKELVEIMCKEENGRE